ncbi:Pyruvate kinase [Petrocella atlantisensis]|uniref:Pyruvate kinase n=1 Tax=Petrocella atlantisensis TaxID=2173034 RepID=A0A3P7P0M5_9FIRM|nr:pyruvate kinase [Petrocella atlantisensis]VDN47020.1 Pyruvate kinase [Petrocella atlantisensis]
MRKTKIICTMGPATEGIYEDMILNGMDAARFNFSHENHEVHGHRIKTMKVARAKLNQPIPLIVDTKGPEMRIGVLKNKVNLVNGEIIKLISEEIEGDEKAVTISFKDLYKSVSIGQSIYIDDGRINLEVVSIEGTDIVCKIIAGGVLSSRKGVNVPGCITGLPFMTEKDRADIEFAVDQDVDFIALSFVSNAKDVESVREIFKQKNREDIKIISKIENTEAIKNIDEIIAVSDSIMIARGDLGIELPVKSVPIIQKKLIKKCYTSSKPVIVATQMLESMTDNPVPTRAEVSDVANAIYDGTSVVMLSGETAAGKYPIETLRMMTTVILETENDIDYKVKLDEGAWKVIDQNVINAISEVTVIAASKIDAKAIVVPTRSGNSVRMISSFRPACPIIAITLEEGLQRQLNLSWGIKPMMSKFIGDQKEFFEKVLDQAVATKLVEKGDLIILTAGIPTGYDGKTNMLKMHKVGDEVIGG